MYQHEKELRARITPFVEALEAEGFEASAFHPGEYSMKVSIAKDGSALGPVVVYYKPSNDTFSISDHEMTNASAFGRIESLFHQSEETTALPGYHAYVDGSYRNDCIGYGWVIYRDSELQHEDFGRTSNFENMRQVVGELKAAIEALKWCESHKIQSVQLHYDYEGIERWATGEWRAKNVLTKRYRHLIGEYEVDIDWVKEDAHTGVVGNERADRLAKKGNATAGSERETEDDAGTVDPVEELKTKAAEFLDYVMESDIPAEINAEADRLYNDNNFARLKILKDECVVGYFDLYNTSNKHLEPRLHGFRTNKIKNQFEELWDEHSRQYNTANEEAIRLVNHLYSVFEPYRRHERFDMMHLVEAIESAYSVIEEQCVSLEEQRFNFGALEKHVEHLRETVKS